jgi:hypothetical protein
MHLASENGSGGVLVDITFKVGAYGLCKLDHLPMHEQTI